MADSQAIKIKHPGNSAQNRENQIRLPDWLCQLCPGGPKIVDFCIASDLVPSNFCAKKTAKIGIQIFPLRVSRL